jgi:hypothetical protein
MATIKRAISIKQPFVEQILRGKKRLEYRRVPTNIRERVYLYASLRRRTDKEAWRGIEKSPDELPKGMIVGSVEITGCKKLGEKDFAYVLANPKRLRAPIVPMNQPSPIFWLPKF